jgi:hypothetical protein
LLRKLASKKKLSARRALNASFLELGYTMIFSNLH